MHGFCSVAKKTRVPVKCEIERNETKPMETKRNEIKRNEIKRNETKKKWIIQYGMKTNKVYNILIIQI